MVEFLKTSKGHNFKPDAIQTLSKGYSELRSNGPFYRPNSFLPPNVNQTCCGWVCIWIGSGIEKMSSSNTVKPDLKHIQVMNQPGAAAVGKKIRHTNSFWRRLFHNFFELFSPLVFLDWRKTHSSSLWCCEVCWLYCPTFSFFGGLQSTSFFSSGYSLLGRPTRLPRKSNIFAFQSFCFLFFIIEILASVFLIHLLASCIFLSCTSPVLASFIYRLKIMQFAKIVELFTNFVSGRNPSPDHKRYSRIDNAL